MAKRKKEFTLFTVEGSGHFPFDMLRYDQCWPYRETDSHLMGFDPLVSVLGRRRVVLKTHSEHAPTWERWRSQGWEWIGEGELRHAPEAETTP